MGQFFGQIIDRAAPDGGDQIVARRKRPIEFIREFHRSVDMARSILRQPAHFDRVGRFQSRRETVSGCLQGVLVGKEKNAPSWYEFGQDFRNPVSDPDFNHDLPREDPVLSSAGARKDRAQHPFTEDFFRTAPDGIRHAPVPITCSGLAWRHFPRVKSGKGSGSLPRAIDLPLSSTTALIITAS